MARSTDRTNRSVTREIDAATANGYLMFVVSIALLVGAAVLFASGVGERPRASFFFAGLFLGAVGVFSFRGLYMLQPNRPRCCSSLAIIAVPIAMPGCAGPIPSTRVRSISLRAHNLNSDKIKVNDKRGNPIEIARRHRLARGATRRTRQFDVENYEEYVRVQSEAAIRHLASSYAYDEGDEEAQARKSLSAAASRKSTAALSRELQERLDQAGIVVEDAQADPSRLRAGDRGRDAAPAAGGSHHRRTPEDRDGRGVDGGDGASTRSRNSGSSSSTTNAKPRW